MLSVTDHKARPGEQAEISSHTATIIIRKTTQIKYSRVSRSVETVSGQYFAKEL